MNYYQHDSLCRLLIVVWLALLRELPASAPIDGNEQALQVVRDVQVANAHAFPRGRLRFNAVFYSRGTDSRHVDVPHRQTWQGDIEWDEGCSYWDFHLDWDVQPGGGEWEPSERPRSIRQVITPTAKFSYAYDIRPGGAAKEYKDRPLRYETLAVLPEQVWYNSAVPPFGSEAPWSNLLNPEFNAKALQKLVVERPDGDRIIVTRHATKGPPQGQRALCGGVANWVDLRPGVL